VIILYIKSKQLILPLSLCLISALAVVSPTLIKAASDTGSIAASKAADQKAALAKKAREREKAAEEKKAAEAVKPVEDEKEIENEKEVEKEVTK
jgi:hypothetical protein